MELRVQVIGLNTTDPLKDVQVTKARQQTKVASLRKILNTRSRHGKLIWFEVADFRVDSPSLHKSSCEPSKILMA